MPFPAQVKARIFVRSARICCLCFKQCGTRIEAAHIVAEADGGPNDDENAIPLCFDCHEEIGSYNPNHPKGNKFSGVELKARRDALYRLVEQGVIQAQIVVHRLGMGQPANTTAPTTAEVSAASVNTPYEPSKEAKAVLAEVSKPYAMVEALPRKLQLLTDQDRGFIIDELLQNFSDGKGADALMQIIASAVNPEQSVLLLEQILRQVTLRGDTEARARVMRLTPVNLLAQTDPGLRTAFFEDVIATMERDQYQEVNVITPAAVLAQSALPEESMLPYLKALLSQAGSDAWYGAPAARKALLGLPTPLAQMLFEYLDAKNLYFLGSGRANVIEFLEAHRSVWPPHREELYEDYLELGTLQFGVKYLSGEL